MPLSYEATQLARDFGESVTMSTNAVNNLLFHLLLAPIYAVIVAQKVMVCNGNSMLAVADDMGYTIGRQDLQDASTCLVGMCLSEKGATGAGNVGEVETSSDETAF